jgi:hypothetical protein
MSGFSLGAFQFMKLGNNSELIYVRFYNVMKLLFKYNVMQNVIVFHSVGYLVLITKKKLLTTL